MVARTLRRVAKTAGIGHVHPHQLRHTFATQAINRGMTLEAIAEMLGHKTLRMTLVYARIVDRTVADAYDRVTNDIDALYTKPTGLRSAPDGTAAMAAPRCRVRPQTPRQRTLHPTRPARLPIRIDLRILRLLLHQPVVRPGPRSPTRPRRRPRPTPPRRPLQHAHRTNPNRTAMTTTAGESQIPLDSITHISAVLGWVLTSVDTARLTGCGSGSTGFFPLGRAGTASEVASLS